jgi:hypothetical protein
MENDEQEQDIVDEETKEIEEEQSTETELKEVKINDISQDRKAKPDPAKRTKTLLLSLKKTPILIHMKYYIKKKKQRKHKKILKHFMKHGTTQKSPKEKDGETQ